MAFFRVPGSLLKVSPSTSVSPSNSISQQPSGAASPLDGSHVHSIQPALHPSQYPVKVLWSLQDYQDDPDVNMPDSNKSCSPMDKAICHTDGRMISTEEWNAIKAST